jgi:uncharacterized protein YjlB
MATRGAAEAIEQYRFAEDGEIPNNPALPLLLYRGALPGGADPAGACERLFAGHGWGGAWRDGIFPYHHYHSTAHEVLGIVRGEARAQFGGPHGETVTVHAGDVVVIPAGVAHRNDGASGDLLVVGAYPDGRDADLCEGQAGEGARAAENVGRVPLPSQDPVHGAGGPLLGAWGAMDGSDV